MQIDCNIYKLGDHIVKRIIDTLERIQRRATKMIPELRDLRYEERLEECGLIILETRRLRLGQIEVFKILNVYENIDGNILGGRVTHRLKCWTLDKPMASLSTCHLGLCLGWQSC